MGIVQSRVGTQRTQVTTAQSQQGAGIRGRLPDPLPLFGPVRAGAHVSLSLRDITAPMTWIKAQTFPHAQLPLL